MEGAFQLAQDIIAAIATPRGSAALRGQTSRSLSSYPDHPVLLFMRAMSEVFSKEHDINVIKQNYNAFADNIVKLKYIDEKEVFRIVSWGLNKMCSVEYSIFFGLYKEMMSRFSDRNFLRFLVADLPEQHAAVPAWDLISGLNSRASRLIVS